MTLTPDTGNAVNTNLALWLPAITGLVSAAIALVIGLLTFQNSRTQIRSTQKIAEAQIAATKDLMLAQTRSNLLATARRQWIEELRKEVVNIFSVANDIHTTLSSGATLEKQFEIFWRAKAQIELMLNPEEQSHRDFIVAMEKFCGVCIEKQADMQEWSAAKSAFFNATRIVLKTEWRKVKALE